MRKIKFVLLTICFSCSQFLIAQKYDYFKRYGMYGNNQFWGNQVPDTVGLGYRMVFDQSPARLVWDTSQINFNILGSLLSIANKDGYPIFYSNGKIITELSGKSENIIEDSLNLGEVYTWPGGYPCTYCMTGVPSPKKTNEYFVFHSGWEASGSSTIKQMATKIIFDSISGLSKIIFKNKVIEDSLRGNPLLPVRSADGKSWYISTMHYNSPDFPTSYKWLNYHTYLLKDDSISIVQQDSFYAPINSGLAQFKASPNGEIIATLGINNATTTPFLPNEIFLMLFEFDRCNGKLFNKGKIPIPLDLSGIVSFEFSPNSQFLYVAVKKAIYQIDLQESVLKADTVAVYDGFKEPLHNRSGFFLGHLTLGPDGKIYFPYSEIPYVGYIAKPNKKGKACTVVQHGIKSNVPNYGAMIIPNYRLGPIDGSPCDTLGVDNHPLADFWWFSDSTLTVEFADNSSYKPTTWSWAFGDGAISNDTSPVHLFPAPGWYNVCLIASNQFSADTICKLVPVGLPTSAIDPELNSKNNLLLSPNPASDLINVYVHESEINSEYQLRLINLLGQTVKQVDFKGSQTDFNVSGISTGLYLIQVFEKGKLQAVGKVFIAR